ncbi:MAG: hypothetical protein HY314_05005 [Acidobacteria bacterium]|nr:hypothetical protein [Acidobacteriota bacterium]
MTMTRSMRSILVFSLAVWLLLCSSVRSFGHPIGRAQGGPAELVVGIVGIVVGVISTAVATAAALPKDKVAIQIDEFSLAVADDFNVGDHGTINLQVSVSFGSISDSLSADETGTMFVRFFADGNLMEEKRVTQTGEPVVNTYTVKATVVGVRPGSTNITANVGVSGQISGTISDDWTWVAVDTPTRVLNVKEPYDVWVAGPFPGEVIHGNPATAKLMVRVRTEDYGSGKGQAGDRTELDGGRCVQPIPGAANAGASYEKVLCEKPKSHDGCPYRPPHPPFFNIPFQPNLYTLWAYFIGGPSQYFQEGTLNPVFAKDIPLDPPTCPDGEEYDPERCMCVPKDLGCSLDPSQGVIEVASSGGTVNLPIAVNGSGPVNLTISGLPQGADAAFNPNPVNAPGTTTLIVNVQPGTQPGNYPLTLMGTTGTGKTCTANVTLNVR